MNALSTMLTGQPASTRRSRDPRVTTVLTTGKLILEDREVLCRVRNLSTMGMMIETGAVLRVGQDLRIGMRCGSEFDASVAWTRDGAAGLKLHAPIDVTAVLAARPARSRIIRQPAARAPRLSVGCPIELEARGQSQQAMLLNISQSGAGLRLPFRPYVDERLLLCVPGLPLKSGAVRWMKQGEVGIRFYEPLPFSTLAAWVESYAQSRTQ